jgi:hypothetical protein
MTQNIVRHWKAELADFINHWGTVIGNRPLDIPAWNRYYLDLLSEMGSVLGYKQLRQTSMDKFYSPEVHGNIFGRQADLQDNLLRVLKATRTLDSIIDEDPE